MVFLIVPITAIFSGIFTALILYRRGRRFKPAVTPLAIASLFIVIGIVFINEPLSDIQESLQRRSWPLVQAEVIASKVAGKRAFHPEITYRYSASGQEFTKTTDLNTPGFGARNSRRDTASRIVAQYPPGTLVSVHYNPEHPDESYIRTGASFAAYLQVFTLLILIFGAGLTLGLQLFTAFNIQLSRN